MNLPPLLEDLDADLEAVRRERLPLLLLVSRSDCNYCEEVRRNYLSPLLHEGRALIREVVSDDAQRAIRATPPTTHAALAKRLQVNFYPTVLLLDGELRQLAEPLLGADHAGFYSAYLERRITEARRKLGHPV